MIGAWPSPESAEGPICSRAGCRSAATVQVVWRNPRIHTSGRRKIWLACDEHAGYLYDYLASRRFPVSTEPFPASAAPAHPEESR